MKIIKVLGPGCTKCKLLEANVNAAASKLSGDFQVAKIEDMAEIIKYGIMSSPGLVIDEKLISSGRVNSVEEITELLK